MRLHRFLFALAAIATLSGCAHQSPDPLAARRKAYQRLASFLEPGMTRRQLYALLPPSRTPSAQWPTYTGGGIPPTYSPQIEDHPLDNDFSLEVQYQLANRHEFAAKIHRATSIHEFLFGKIPLTPSRQNPDDVLVARPIVMSHGSGPLMGIKSVDHEGRPKN